MDIWVISMFWLLRIMLLKTQYKLLCGHVFVFLLGLHLGIELLSHTLTLCHQLRND